MLVSLRPLAYGIGALGILATPGNVLPTDTISTRVMDIKWFLGMQKPYQSIADN